MQLKERALAKSGTTVPKYVAIAPVIASWLFSRLSDYSATHVSVSARFSRITRPSGLGCRNNPGAGITQSVFCPAARPRTVRCGYAADPRRWAKNVLDG